MGFWDSILLLGGAFLLASIGLILFHNATHLEGVVWISVGGFISGILLIISYYMLKPFNILIKIAVYIMVLISVIPQYYL